MDVQLSLNKDMVVNVQHFGNEQLPVLVIDNFLAEPELLVEHACQQSFKPNSQFYPGIRAVAPKSFQRLLLGSLGRTFKQVFQLQGNQLGFSICHYSIVTTPADQLQLLQRIPHFDSIETDQLAAVFYLFKQDLGGTSFYRHRKTGFEYVDKKRQTEYYQSLESENGTENIPQSGYINGDSALFTRIGEEQGVFNRLIVYRRQCLHSGSIRSDFVPNPDPRQGRLTISAFIDCI